MSYLCITYIIYVYYSYLRNMDAVYYTRLPFSFAVQLSVSPKDRSEQNLQSARRILET